MEIKESLGKLKGTVIIKNLRTGKEEKYENVVTSVGIRHMFYLAGGNSSDTLSWFGCGTGTTAPTIGDTALETENGDRVFISLSGKSYTTSYMEFLINVGGGDFVYTWRELGIFSASSGGTLFARIAVNYVHSAGDPIQIIWRWTMS